jgi:hypothetical protein
MAEVQDHVSVVELEGSSSDEESDVELSETLSTTSGSNSVSRGFDSDDSSMDNERAGRDTGAETPNLSQTESDSVLQTDDEELASGASGKQEATKKIVYEARNILDLFGNISSSSAFIVPTRLQISNLSPTQDIFFKLLKSLNSLLKH